jgi:hypothetical protein
MDSDGIPLWPGWSGLAGFQLMARPGDEFERERPGWISSICYTYVTSMFTFNKDVLLILSYLYFYVLEVLFIFSYLWCAVE